MAESTVQANVNSDGSEERGVRSAARNKTSLMSLCNPSRESLDKCTKSELQKHCTQLGISGIWTNKEKLIDKLLIHYKSMEKPRPSSDIDQEREKETNETNVTSLLHRFENFVKETNDNFYVVNKSLAEKEKEIEELKTKLYLAEEKIKHLQDSLQNHSGFANHDGPITAPNQGTTLLVGD